MGHETEILLVKSGILKRWAMTAILSITLAACAQEDTAPLDAAENRVAAEDYDAFWLWAGVEPQPVLNNAQSVYIVDSELRKGAERFTILRADIPQVQDIDIWMVVRVETLNWSAENYQQIIERLKQWRAASRLVGLQIDFDAATGKLDDYTIFLKKLRAKLPKGVKLGVTGLLDWSANGDPAALNALNSNVDEIVIQTYQGRSTITGYTAYLNTLAKGDVRYKIGLVQNGLWREPVQVAKDPDFQGYVVFLVNP